MKKRLSILQNLVLAGFVVVALAFGATQAWAAVSECTIPGETCIGEPPSYCNNLCISWDYEGGGFCYQAENCCVCAEK